MGMLFLVVWNSSESIQSGCSIAMGTPKVNN